MSATVTLSNVAFGGATSLSLTDPNSYKLMGEPTLGRMLPDGSQEMVWPLLVKGVSEPDLASKITVLRRLVNEAERQRRIGRRVALTINADNGTATTYYLLKGWYDDSTAAISATRGAKFYEAGAELHLVCEALGRSAETQAVTSGTLRSALGLTAVYVRNNTGPAFGVNIAQVQAGYLFQTTKFTTTPAELTMAASMAVYYGGPAAFDRIILGLTRAAVWSGTGVWEFWNGATWTALTPTVNDFKVTRDWDTLTRLGAIGGWGTLTGWTAATLTAAGITGSGIPVDSLFWIRWRISAFTSVTTSPLHCNGYGSLSGLAEVGAGAVPGDTDAVALVHVTNPGATALAGVEAALIVGELSDEPPMMEVDLAGADTFIPTGDTTAAVVASASAAKGERVDVTFVASLADRAQTFDGSTQSATVTVASGDKIDHLGDNGSFLIETIVKFDVVPSGPFPLVSRWNTSSQVLWCGLDQGKLKFMVYNSSGRKRVAYGTTTIAAGEQETLSFEYDRPAQRIRVYRATGLEAEASVGAAALRAAVTTNFQLAHSQGFTVSADSRDASTAETYFDGAMSYLWVEKRTVATIFGAGHYPAPDAKRTTEGYANVASANTVLYYEMDDNAATTTLVDTATGSGAAKNLTRTGNSSANTTVGYFQGGVGSTTRLLGTSLPQTWGEEYGGSRVRIWLAASPSATLTTIDDVILRLQLNVGDVDLPLGPPAQFPNVQVPSGDTFYLLDMGVYTLPPVRLRDNSRGSGSAANMLAANLFVKHAFITAAVVRFDCLYLQPLDVWAGGYRTFRDGYSTSYDIDQNTGLLWDNTGPFPVVSQTGSAYTIQTRNPYADPRGSDRPRLVPGRPGWLVGIPVRGAVGTTSSYVYRVTTDSLTARIHLQGRYEALASA